MPRNGVCRWGRVAAIVTVVWLAILVVPDVRLSGGSIPCPTSFSATTVTFSLIPRAAASPCPGLEWVRTYETADEGYARAIQPTSDGGYVLVFGWGFSIAKLDARGNVMWGRDYAAGLHGFGWGARETPDGGYVLVGETLAFGAGSNDGWIVKLNATGAIEWQRTYGSAGGDFFRAVSKASDGGYVLAGSTSSVDGTDRVWVVKLAATGELVWQRAYDAGRAWSVDVVPGGGYVVAAGSGYYGGLLVLRLDDSGALVWRRSLVGNGGEARSVRSTSDGGFVVGGFIPVGSRYRDVIVKLDASGNVQWRKSYQVHEMGYNADGFVQPTPDGGYFLAGSFYTTRAAGAGRNDFALLRVDPNGNVLWSKLYGTALDEKALTGAYTAADGGFVLAGQTITSSYKTYAWVVKTDGNGNVAPACPSGIGASLSLSPGTPKLAIDTASTGSIATSASVLASSAIASDLAVSATTLCSA